MRRVISVWLPRFATDRLTAAEKRRGAKPPNGAAEKPRVLLRREGGSLRLAAVDARAASAGLVPGLPLADARAMVSDLDTAEQDPIAEARALAALAAWCGRFTPWVAPDRSGCDAGGGAGLLLDVTGCAHLFGGEVGLLAALRHGLERQGLSALVALADTPGLAWAMARFGPAAESVHLVPAGEAKTVLAELPVAALRLSAEPVELLERLGLRRVGDLYDLPPSTLARRVGPMVAHRLAQALGRAEEAISPLTPVPPLLERLALPEPSLAPEAVAFGLDRLIQALCRRLETEQKGARRLVFTLYRADGSLGRLKLGTSRPSRDPQHLKRLFAQRLEQADPGFGVEVMTLAATASEPLGALQMTAPQMALSEAGVDAQSLDTQSPDTQSLGEVVDRLMGRLGEARVARPVPRESHVPERAVASAAPVSEGPMSGRPDAPWQPRGPFRPLRLFPKAQPIEATALLPDHPPSQFRWRRQLHRIATAEGPERLSPEWWHPAAAEKGEDGPGDDLGDSSGAAAEDRDYFRVEDDDGRRYWVYRTAGRWYLHGLFA